MKYEVQSEIKTDEPEDSLDVYFTSNFKGDTVKIFTEHDVVFNKVITTNHTVGVADYLNLKINNKLKLSINNCNYISIEELNKYRYLYVELNKKRCLVTKTNEERFFK